MPRRPTVDGPAHNVHLHNPYAAAPRTLWATSPPAPPLTLPKLAWRACRHLLLRGNPHTLTRRARCFFLYRPSGPDGTTHFPGNLALCHAHHAAKIGLAGLTVPLAPREFPHPPPPLTLHFSLSALAVFALQLTYRVGSAASFWSASHALLFLPYPCGGKPPALFMAALAAAGKIL